jgi:hypothetical protein
LNHDISRGDVTELLEPIEATFNQISGQSPESDENSHPAKQGG